MPQGLSMSSISRVVTLHNQGFGPSDIANILRAEGLRGCRQTVSKMIHKLKVHGAIIYPRPGRSGIAKVQVEHLEFIDAQMKVNDELTARDLQKLLIDRFGLSVSVPTIKRHRYQIGWIKSGPRYCQLIREQNRELRLAWCQKTVLERESFDDVVFTDETIISLDSHAKLCFRKRWDKLKEGEVYTPKMKPRPKHPVKVFAWAGISKRGACPIVIFKGIMDAGFFCREILTETLRPWVFDVYPEKHRLQQDNDPKHKSRLARDTMQAAGINWWPTPAESPDLNPIECVWHELKNYLRKVVKPRSQDALVDGIAEFWTTRMTVAKCCRYIGHLNKVIPVVIERKGYPSGY